MNKEEKGGIALEKAQQALTIYSALYGESHVKTAKIRLFVAREIRNLRRDEEAYALFEQSLQVFEIARDTPQMAITHNLLCSCRRNQKRLAEARQHIEMSILLMRPDSSHNFSLMADFKTTLGYIYNDEKNFAAALQVLEQAKAVQILKKNAEALAIIYFHLGGAYFGLHDYVRAKENYLTSSVYLKGQRFPDHSYFTDLQVNVGLCFQKTGDPDTGLAHLLKAKEAYLKFGVEDFRYTGFLQTLGQFYLEEKKYAEAIEQFEECLATKEKTFGIQNQYLLGTLRSLGEACTAIRQFGRANDYYRRGLYIARNLPGGGVNFCYPIYSDLAALHMAQGDYTGSLRLCDTAFTVSGFDPSHPEKMIPRDVFRELCERYAQSLVFRFGQTADTAYLFRAERYFALAAETLYREVAEVTVNNSKEIFYDRDHPVLEQWLDTRMKIFEQTKKREHAEAAFLIAGRSKAFLLAEAMRQDDAIRSTHMPDSLIQTELNLRGRIITIEKTLDDISPKSTPQSDSVYLALNRQMSDWRTQHDAVLRHMEQRHPEQFPLRLQRRNVTTGELRLKHLAAGQGLLMYSLTATRIYVFVLTRDTFCAIPLPLDAQLNSDIENFRKSLTEYFSAGAPDDAQYDLDLKTYTALAQSLYQKLVQPVAALLPARVVVIPEGKLCYLPFEALLTNAPTHADNFRTYPFWLRKKAISYAPSTELVAKTNLSPLKSEKTWLGLAPFSETAGTASNINRGEHFAPLPFSGKEVRDIAALLQGEVWLGASAKPGRFQQEAARFRILHLATHSRADDRLGRYSYIATSNSAEPMSASELYQVALTAEMVVLSACEAGSGKLLRGEGIIGLVRAFTYAGARSIVAPLWVANDQRTADLMVDFYRNLRKGQSKDVALQGARLRMLDQSPDAAHPFFWAGFRLYGQVAPLWK